jgi:transposase
MRAVTEEDVSRWAEAYQGGESTASIAKREGRSARTVYHHLVLRDPAMIRSQAYKREALEIAALDLALEGLNQKEIARRLGVGAQSIRRWLAPVTDHERKGLTPKAEALRVAQEELRLRNEGHGTKRWAMLAATLGMTEAQIRRVVYRGRNHAEHIGKPLPKAYDLPDEVDEG